MKFVGAVSLLTGWFGAVMAGATVGGYAGQAIGFVLVVLVGMAHNWIATGKL